MDLRPLSYFVAVVDHGGFSAAADEVRVAQPSLSQSIRRLEADLGTPLFDRVGRTVRLTAAGEALLEPARQALRDLDTARAAVEAVRDLSTGFLELACLSTLAEAPVAGHIGAFRMHHPGITVRVLEPEESESVADLVRSGRVEVGYSELSGGGHLVEHELAAQEFVAVVPRSDDHGSPITLAELAAMPLITTRPGTSTRRLLDGAFASAGCTPFVAVESDHREVIPMMVRAGAGYSVLPRPVAARIARRDAHVLEIEPAMTRRIGVIHRDTVLSPAGRAFMEVVQGT